MRFNLHNTPPPNNRQSRARRLRLLLVTLLCGVQLFGCRSRSDYRRWADCATEQIIQQRQCDPLWDIPERSVTPDPRSRMADPYCPDCEPLPPDDPAAHTYMHCADCRAGWPHWHEYGNAPSIEFPNWRNYLGTQEDGVLVLSKDNVMELALLNSRDYQTAFDQLYFSALSLTLDRFDFDHQWFGSSNTFFDTNGTGGPPFESRLLSVTNGFGFSKNFTTGGQLLVDFANSLVWEFAGNNVSMASSSLLFSMAQPLLRGAFRQVRMEQLTQSERDVLYVVRDFAHFRRSFYVDISGADGYLGLLAVRQAIKNQKSNLESLARNLDEHEKLLAAGLVAPIQVDQVYQQYQQGRLNLLAAEQVLEAALDRFKIQLGLPPQFEVRIDDDALTAFELSSMELDELGDENEELRLSLLQYDDQPPAAEITRGLKQIQTQQQRLKKLHAEVESEWKKWQRQLDARPEPTDEDEKESQQREADLAKRLKEILDEVEMELEEDESRIKRAMEKVTAEGEDEQSEDDEEDDARESSESEEPDTSSEEATAEDDSATQESPDAEPVDEPESGGTDEPGELQRDHDASTDESLSESELFRRLQKNSQAKRVRHVGFQEEQESSDDDADSEDEPLLRLGDENSDRASEDANEEDDDEERQRKERIQKESPWEALQELVGQEFRKHLAELFVVQTQIRVFLINVTDLEMDSDEAVALAIQNRLDLMNQRGIVVDSYRQVVVAADALEADLDVRLEAELGTDPNRANPVRFDASANRYRAGFEFDSPLTRLAERNAYRVAQIQYQQARRDFMALEDQVASEIRADIRSLRFNRFSFDIARQQLIVAARQVDEAQVNLRNSTEPNSSFTRDLLTALQRLLDVQNNFIRSWVDYETSRMNLYRDLELMNIAPSGAWLNEYDDPSTQTETFTNDDGPLVTPAAEPQLEPVPSEIPSEIQSLPATP